ncbi:transposase [Parageobacillus thermoglucosidasius]|nr:transposase [Parageobacillus thermoglucosidasius]
MLKCFFLKTYFAIDSLRKLVRVLQFRCFQQACGLGEVPHLSTFSRAAKWFPETGISCFSCTAAPRSRSTVSPNRADRQHAPWKQSL